MEVITEQQAKADNSSAGSKDLQQKPDRMTGALEKFEKCNSAQNETLCKMNVMGLSGEGAISILGLNKTR